MDIEWLEEFLVLSDMSSFTRAAHARNVTQSAFSRRIRSLEDWIGISLVDRDTVPPRLTMAGHLFRDAAREMVRQLQDTRIALGHRSKVFSGIKLFVTQSLVQQALPEWMHQINQRISGLKFDIQAGETYEGVIALSSGRCDLLMAYHSPLVPMSIDEKLSPSITLGKDKLVPVSQADEFGSPMHRLIESKLRHLPLLSFPPETFFGRICNGIIRFRPSDPNFNVMVQSANARVLHTLALEGLGIAWLPQRCVANDIAEGRLALAGDDEWSAKIDIRLYASHERARLLNANLLDNIRDLKHENLAVR
ncbi:MAG: LysR substrate-binding domain-containing protein [Burkholderiaceae bacterium]